MRCSKDVEKRFAEMQKDIDKAKRKLSKKQIYENFGAEEERQIREKYSDLMVEDYARYCSLIHNFSEWCGNQEWRC